MLSVKVFSRIIYVGVLGQSRWLRYKLWSIYDCFCNMVHLGFYSLFISVCLKIGPFVFPYLETHIQVLGTKCLCFGDHFIPISK